MRSCWPSTPDRIRTCDLRIRSPHATSENVEKNALSQNSAAPGAADGTREAIVDADLQAIIDRWPDLSEATRRAILAAIEEGNTR